MKKTGFNIILYIVMFLFGAAMIFVACRQSNQAMMSYPLPLQFVGEYCQDEGEWQLIGKETDLSGYYGDLVLRGRFDEELPDGAIINFYLEHIGMNIYLNGEIVLESSCEIFPDMCGRNWASWVMPSLETDDVIEIRLHNPHSYGNADAYNEFLDSIYVCNPIVLKDNLEKQGLPYRIVSAFIIIASIAFVGTAIGYALLRLPKSSILLKLAIMSLLMGVYMFVDTKDISFRSEQIVFNTYILQLSMMFAVWMLDAGVTELLGERRKKIAEIAVYVSVFVNFILMVLSFAGVMRIYDTGIYWAVMQGIVSLVLLVLSAFELKKCEKKEWLMLLSGMVLLASLIIELINAYADWWQSGNCIKAIFTVLFALHLIKAVRWVAVNYEVSIRAEKLEKELKENQVALAISQIQPHFIYNSLNCIYHLCDKDVQMAQQAISDFSEYLQRSISAIDRTTLISFAEELKHIRTYLKLQQMRFGEDLRVIYRVAASSFMLPALSVQPLVENAVQHGICRKEGGGTVIVTTKETPRYFEIIVFDNGAGFCTEKVNEEEGTHIGIKNVRQRLQIMCNGTLEIVSEPGKNTTATIRIPKENRL